MTVCGDFSGTTGMLVDGRPGVARFVGGLRGRLKYGLFIESGQKIALATRKRGLCRRISITCRRLRTTRTRLTVRQDVRDKDVAVDTDRVTLRLLLLPVLKHFRGRCPNIQLELLGRSAPRTIRSIGGKLTSFTIIAAPLRTGGPLGDASLVSFGRVTIKSRSFRKGRGPVELGSLVRGPLVSLKRKDAACRFCSGFFLRGSLILSPSARIRAVSRILPLVVGKLNVKFLPRLFMEPIVRRKGIYRVLLGRGVPRERVYLIRGRAFPPDVTTRVFGGVLILGWNVIWRSVVSSVCSCMRGVCRVYRWGDVHQFSFEASTFCVGG